MKLGQLMLNGGTWRGRILGADFVSRAAAPLHDLGSIQYGFLWWNMEYRYKGRRVRGFFAGGNGGQVVMVVPGLDLVIATYGGNYWTAPDCAYSRNSHPTRSCPPSASRVTMRTRR